MDTSGNRSSARHRGGFRLIAVLALICLVATSCQSGSSPPGGSKSAATTNPTDSERAWCKAKPDAAWERALDGHLVALSRQISVGPLALPNDGHSFFAEIYSNAYSGIVRIDALSGRYTKIKRFTDPANYQASGDFDGRWLVWAEYHSLYDAGDFTVWSWDSRSGRVRQIGAATRSPSGVFWPSAYQAPIAHDGYATWQQALSSDGLGEIHVVDLATGRDRVVRHGHPTGPFLVDGPRVIWPESMKRGALTVMRTADAKTGRIIATPPALRKLRGGIWPASNGKSVMYATDGQMSLWWSPSLRVTPKLVFASRNYQLLKIPFSEIHGRYTSFSIPYKTYIVDVSAGRYVRISRGGWAIVGHKALVLLAPSEKKANHAITDIFYVPLKSLPPVPTCP